MKVRTYKELEEWITLFREKKINILILISKSGLGKSELIRDVMGNDEYLYVNSHITPFSLYKQSYENKDKPIIIDDINEILDNKEMLSIIKQLSETKAVKKMQWNSIKTEDNEIPQNFYTTSNILLIGNKIKKLSSILNRGVYLFFEPTKEEVINKIKSITGDNLNNDILKEVEQLDNPTLRHYFKALDIYSKENDKWKQYIRSDISPKLLVCKKIIEEFPKNQWIKIWLKTGIKQGKVWTRQNFYYYYNKLNAKDIDMILNELKNEMSKVSVQQKNVNWTLDTFKTQKF